MTTTSTTKRPRTTKQATKQATKPSKAFKAVVEYAKPTAPTPNTMAATLQALNTAPKADKPKAARKAKGTGSVFVISKQFRPRTNHVTSEDKGRFAQQANWDALVACMDEHEDGASYADLVAALTKAAEAGGYLAWANVPGFIAGRIRGEHIVAV
jgi:hypothetical protein